MIQCLTSWWRVRYRRTRLWSRPPVPGDGAEPEQASRIPRNATLRAKRAAVRCDGGPSFCAGCRKNPHRGWRACGGARPNSSLRYSIRKSLRIGSAPRRCRRPTFQAEGARYKAVQRFVIVKQALVLRSAIGFLEVGQPDRIPAPLSGSVEADRPGGRSLSQLGGRRWLRRASGYGTGRHLVEVPSISGSETLLERDPWLPAECGQA